MSNMPKETSQEHSIWHSGCAFHGNVGHPFGHVVGQVEGLPSLQRVEHVAKAKIHVIPVSYGANDIGSKEFLPFLELRLKFIEFHTIGVLVNFISGMGSPSVGGPNKEMITKYILGHKWSVIGMDAVKECVKSC
jgi:hypothetical protein